MFARAAPQTRCLLRAFATKAPARAVPQPTADVPDVKTFLSKIGRNCIEHEEQFAEWKELFTADGQVLKQKGLDIQTRRYILKQVEKFRQGEPLREYKTGKKSFYGGERTRKERIAKLEAEKRAERYAHEDAQK